MHRNIINHTGNMPAGFTGIVYNDVGKFNYAPMIGGEFVRSPTHKTRWCKTAMAAAAIIDRINGEKTTWVTRV